MRLRGCYSSSYFKDGDGGDGGLKLSLFPTPLIDSEDPIDKNLKRPCKKGVTQKREHCTLRLNIQGEVDSNGNATLNSSNSRCSAMMKDKKKKKLELQSCTEGQSSSLNKTSKSNLTQRMFLFEKTLNRRDVTLKKRLVIPLKMAEAHFPCPKTHNDKEMLQLTDCYKMKWDMSIEWDCCSGYCLRQGWKDFVNRHDLQSNDVIRFYKLDTNLDDKHYFIECEKPEQARTKMTRLFDKDITNQCKNDCDENDSENGNSDDQGHGHRSGMHKGKSGNSEDQGEEDSNGNAILNSSNSRCSSMMQDKKKKLELQSCTEGQSSSLNKTSKANPTQRMFLFEKTLTRSDVTLKRKLIIPLKVAKAHFPHLKTHNDKEMLQFTDCYKTKWDMSLEWDRNSGYWLMQGWKDFVDRHDLQSNDVIRFYKLDTNLDDKHYFIEYEKPEQARTKMTQLFGEDITSQCKNDCNEDDSENGNSDDQGHGHRSGRHTGKSGNSEDQGDGEPEQAWTKIFRLFGEDITAQCKNDSVVDGSENGNIGEQGGGHRSARHNGKSGNSDDQGDGEPEQARTKMFRLFGEDITIPCKNDSIEDDSENGNIGDQGDGHRSRRHKGKGGNSDDQADGKPGRRSSRWQH